MQRALRRWLVAVVLAAAAAPAAAAEPQLQGVGSCAAAACHNANGPRASKGSEYTTWATHDPHANAYVILFNPQSLQIQKNLIHAELAKEGTLAHENALCLGCHAEPAAPFRADGVGCESCHGPAEQWKATHYRSGFARTTPGFQDLKDLTVRAQACVKCHVGEGDRDVNHDLIAAGHPRLRFELGAYLKNYPKHWSEGADRTRNADFEARAWAVGQAVSAQAALALLQHRAATPGKPWPEFAEYDCAACHHSLKGPDSRAVSRPGRKVGELPWGTWYFSLAGALVGPGGAPLRELEDLMARSYPDRVKVQEKAGEAEAALLRWRGRLEGMPANLATVHALAGEFAAVKADQFPAGPDDAVQFYLAAAALHNALTDCDKHNPNVARRDAVVELGKRLDALYVTPDGTRYATPRFLDQAAWDDLKKRLAQLRELLQPN
jgi:hypothetical protein